MAKKRTPQVLREEAKRLKELANAIEQKQYEKIGRSFHAHMVNDFKGFNLENFAKEVQKIKDGE